jgi:SAM-dependent methyltransferase
MACDANETSEHRYTMDYTEVVKRFISRPSAALRPLLPHLRPDMRLLDVGCGPGTISVGLADVVAPGEFHRIDIVESQVEFAAATARDAGRSNAYFHVGDALALPFADDRFDAVHSCAVLTHVPDTVAVLAEMKRILRKGGVMGPRLYRGLVVHRAQHRQPATKIRNASCRLRPVRLPPNRLAPGDGREGAGFCSASRSGFLEPCSYCRTMGRPGARSSKLLGFCSMPVPTHSTLNGKARRFLISS